jgi:hypothetical protein
MASRFVELEEPWLQLLGADPDDVRDIISAIGAPYPARMAAKSTLVTGPKTGVSIEIRPAHRGGHVVEAFVAELDPVPQRPVRLPAGIVAGESRVSLHERLGPPHRTGQLDVWRVDGGTLSVRFDRDRVVGLVLRMTDWS